VFFVGFSPNRKQDVCGCSVVSCVFFKIIHGPMAWLAINPHLATQITKNDVVWGYILQFWPKSFSFQRPFKPKFDREKYISATGIIEGGRVLYLLSKSGSVPQREEPLDKKTRSF